MQRFLSIIGLFIPLAAGTAFCAGCSADAENCMLIQEPCAGSIAVGIPAVCIPSENPDAVHDSCGIFVSSSQGDDSNPGTVKSAPKATLAAAIQEAVAAKQRIYACAESFTEAVVVPAGLSLYGALDCENGWKYLGPAAKTRITPVADFIPLTLAGDTGLTRIQDVVAHARDAMTPGGSSIATLVLGSTAELTRCEFLAGNGATGENGESFPDDPALDGTDGNPGAQACAASASNGSPGALSAAKICDGGVMTVGGAGGDGGKVLGPPLQALAAGDGEDGQPAAVSGTKGTGEPETGAWDCGIGMGQAGSDGEPGEPGAGALGLGTLGASGYVPLAGTASTAGKPGQGGGGGGGAKGGTDICSGGEEGAGASGGSGGSGGCGGKGAGGGKGGGASIALVSLDAGVTLTHCILVAGHGGNGGVGGDGQAGGTGGKGGPGGSGSIPAGGSNAGCDGGNGGQGGSGGPAGGGLGGPSLGIAHTGKAPHPRGTVTITKGSPGAGGPGGNTDSAKNGGADGIAAEIQMF